MPKKKSAKPAKPKKAGSEKTSSKKAKLNKKVSPDQYFILVDGRAIKDVKELALMLDDISDDVFRHHVNDERNDFANWVRHVFDDEDLAELLQMEKEIDKTQKLVFRHLINLI